MKGKSLWGFLLVFAAVLIAGWGFRVRAKQALIPPSPPPLGKKGPILDENGVALHPTSTPNAEEIKRLPFSRSPSPTPATVIDLAPDETANRYEIIILDKNDQVKIVFKVPLTMSEEDALARISGKYYFPEKGESYFVAPAPPPPGTWDRVRRASNARRTSGD